MKRRKIKKIRTTISIDEDIFEESGLYIYNLSAFVQECMRREIQKQKDKLRISSNMLNEKRPFNYNEEPQADEPILSIDEIRALLK